jgi:7,8-dihydroneopterin aldolase/epimerase/oxygenase
MDTLFIRGLEVRVIIGANDWERQVQQTIIVNLEMNTDARAPAAHDDLTQALDYSAVISAIEGCVNESNCRLIETLAEGIATLVRKEFGVRWLRLELIKPRPLAGRHVVGVVIERGSRHEIASERDAP